MTDGSAAGGERAHWEARYAESADAPSDTPSPWILAHSMALPPDTLFVDVAGGTGRHAVRLADAGRRVVVLDFVARAVLAARQRSHGTLGIVADAGALPIRPRSVGAIICVNFLDRTIFPALVDLLAPGGVLLYETFTVAHLDLVMRGRARGPRNRTFLLEPGEIVRLVAPLEIHEHAEETVVDAVGERSIARVLAVKR